MFHSASFTAKSSQCSQGCKLALASYFVLPSSDNHTTVANYFEISDYNVIQSYNTHNFNLFQSFSRYKFPFPCDCIGGEFLGHVFHYITQPNDIRYSCNNTLSKFDHTGVVAQVQ